MLAVAPLHAVPAAADVALAEGEPVPISATPVAQASGGTSPATPGTATPGTAAGTAAPATAASTPAARMRGKWTLNGSLRVRQEAWDWFGSLNGADRYTFTGSLLRVGANYANHRYDLGFEVSQPTLLNLPKDASQLPPLGQLGLGANYRDANGSQEASLFIKQAFVRFKGVDGPENSLRLGRFEFIDGTETTPKDPSLAWLKRERIAHRVIGNFGWSHVQRSFDGGQFVRNLPEVNLTFFAGMPTEGVFDLDGGATLDRVKVGYGAATIPFGQGKFQGEGRIFGMYYRDDRDGVIKSDNRSLADPAALAADQENVGIATLGGHYLGLWDTGGGKIDTLAWAAGQLGDWGVQSHRSFAYAVEVGYQPKNVPWSPWFRAGYYHAAGDGDPTDGTHGTYFPGLPTPRIYARFPFYTLTNLNDLFGQVILRPSPRLTLRADVHSLRLASGSDLWYGGGGAFNNPTFGYGGRPGGGDRGLATLVDISADYQLRKYTSLTAYVGYAAAGDVIDNIYPGSKTGLFGYFEVTQRW